MKYKQREGRLGGGEMTLTEAATSVFLSGVLKGAEECLRFLKGSSAAFYGSLVFQHEAEQFYFVQRYLVAR